MAKKFKISAAESVVYKYLSSHEEVFDGWVSIDGDASTAPYMALGFVKYGSQIYKIDENLSKNAPLDKWAELLPDVLDNAPFPAFYIKQQVKVVDGVFFTTYSSLRAFSDYKADNPVYEELSAAEQSGRGVYQCKNLTDGYIVNNGRELAIILISPLVDGEKHSIEDTQITKDDIQWYLGALTYMCSRNADIRCIYKPNKSTKPNPKKKRSQATWHEVGFRIGAELREYERTLSERKPHQGGTVRPHMRRAHWHHYWTGPRDGERELVLRWIPPTMVALKNGPIEGATGHYVPVSTNA